MEDKKREKVLLPSQRACWVHQSWSRIRFLAHNAKQRAEGLKSDPGGNHYYVGCLGLTCILLPRSDMYFAT